MSLKKVSKSVFFYPSPGGGSSRSLFDFLRLDDRKMPGEAAVTVALEPHGNAATTASEKSCPFVLKKIMDIPPPNILEEGDNGKTKTLCG